MKILLAPNAFKGCLTAHAAAAAMKKGALTALPSAELVEIPVADGGDGLTEICLKSLRGRERSTLVTGPLGGKIAAHFCHLPERQTAIIEMAAAAGLTLIPEARRNPLETSSFGVGELIAAALALDVNHLIIGLGGSATCDGGMGMLDALGIRFLDQTRHPLKPVGANLQQIRTIDLQGILPQLAEVRVEVMCDVQNPLLGEQGSARVYAPQKGATPEQVEMLEAGMTNFADVVERVTKCAVHNLPSGGAAGGMGAGLHAFLGGKLRSGIDTVLDLLKFEETLVDADLVLTGEGRLDSQSAAGKAPLGVARLAKARGVPCVVIAGGLSADISQLHEEGINAMFSLCPEPLEQAAAEANAAEFLSRASEQVVRLFAARG